MESDEVSGLFRAVMQVHDRLILVDDDRIESPVVIEVSDGQPAAEVQLSERPARSIRYVGQTSARICGHELQAHHPGNLRPGVEDMRLDFGIERRDVAVQCDYLPPDLIRVAALLGLGIELSQYPARSGAPIDGPGATARADS